MTSNTISIIEFIGSLKYPFQHKLWGGSGLEKEKKLANIIHEWSLTYITLEVNYPLPSKKCCMQ